MSCFCFFIPALWQGIASHSNFFPSTQWDGTETIQCPHCGDNTLLKAPTKSKSKRTKKGPPRIDPSWGNWDELTPQQKELARTEQEFIVDVEDWREFYPWLTWKRVQEAARHLDVTQPGWREAKNRIELNAETIVKLHPELRDRKRGRKPHQTKSQGCLVVLALVFGSMSLLLMFLGLLVFRK